MSLAQYIKPALALIAAILICLAAGGIGSIFTSQSTITGWYANLQKPSFTPPNWLFGPVWTTLYIFMGIAAFLVWQKGPQNPAVKTALLFFAGQLILNTAWSWLFFGMNYILLAFIELLILWLAILLTILKFYSLSTTAFLLMLPYLVWVSFAALLNCSIWLLNI